MIYFLTCAVERTPVHATLWQNVLAYADLLGAQVLVKPILYKNRNNPHEADPLDDAWWAPEVAPYSTDDRVDLNSNLQFAGDVRVVPTASNPLSGLQLLGHNRSMVFAHPRQHLKSYPAANSKYAKQHWSSGAVTLPNYSDTKLGVRAAAHHIHGFLIVEVEGDEIFHARNVNALSSSGAFVDSARGLLVDGGEVLDAPPAQCLRIGDSHAHEQYEPVIRAVEEIRDINAPERVLVDDIYSHSVAGHRLERDSWRFKAAKRKAEKTVQEELDEAFALIERLGATDIMHSNHHDHLDEWLDNTDGRDDPDNLSTWAWLLARVAAIPGVPAFELAHLLRLDARFWRRGQRCVIGGVRHDHGHEGFNGARGSANSWYKAGCKMTTAHTHVSSIRDGHVCVGHTSDPDKHHYADATKSAWSWSVCVQDCLGKRQLIHIVEGRFTDAGV